MATYFLDSSAIIKRYVAEEGQVWIATLCNPTQGHELYIAQVTLVEVVAAICRRAREQGITIEDRDTFISTFRQDSQRTNGVLPVPTTTYTSPGNLCLSNRFLAFATMQLAGVLNFRCRAL